MKNPGTGQQHPGEIFSDVCRIVIGETDDQREAVGFLLVVLTSICGADCFGSLACAVACSVTSAGDWAPRLFSISGFSC